MAHEVGAFAKGRKCPCCNNPWNGIEDADIILGSTMNKNVNMLSCEPCLADNKGYKGLDPSNMDPSISCKENFYLYSNGMWKKNNEIPAEYSSWNTFIKLRDMNLDRLKVIVDELLSADSTASDDEQKLADFYSTALDENITESIGINALRELIDICKEASTNVTSAISKLHSRYGIRVLFSLSSSPDKKNSEHTIASISQSGIGLPDRDYYFDADKEDKREKYMIYIESLLALLYQGDPSLICYSTSMKRKLAAKEVLLLETALASAFLTRTECRDPELTYNKMTVDELKSLTKNITQWSTYLTRGVNITEVSWDEYFSSVGRASSELGDINVSMIKALQQINDTINHPSFYHYLVFHCLNSYAPHLPAAFVDVHFNFHEKELKGTAAQKPRWKRALEALEEALGDSLGVCYVMRYFSGDAKDRALRIVEQVRDALRSRLQEVDWMQNDTKVEALRKMERFNVKIGFPDKWIDYTTLVVHRGKLLQNVAAGRAFAFQLDLLRINEPTEKHRWYITPQTVNAYYHPSLNEIVFPAAILQPPFFDPDADDAVNFGSMGAVVGHEMTHGFDDKGRKFDFVGNMRDWWTVEDGRQFDMRAEVMVRQAESFSVHGVSLKGKLTCGENIADLGGLKLAFRALSQLLAENASRGKEAPLINGFTPQQRFFLAWAQCWRENSRIERALQLVTIDPHGPNEWRCNGPLSNMSEFYAAFDVHPEDAMFRPPAERVDIW